MNKPPPDHTRFRAFDLTAISVGSNNILIHFLNNRKSTLLSSQEASFLFSCQTFEPLAIHAERWCRARQKSRTNAVKGIRAKYFRMLSNFSEQNSIELPVQENELKPLLTKLREWTKEGFLVSEQELLDEITSLVNRNEEDESESVPINTIGIPTCNRPEMLKRCLTSYIENNRKYDREVKYLIADDSINPEMQKKNKNTLKELARSSGEPMHYTGRKQREHVAELLARRSGISPEVCRFAVLGDQSCSFTGGANRNTLMLQTTCQRSVQVDDDSVCRLVGVSDAADTPRRLSLSSRSDPYEYWFYKDRDVFLNAISSVNEDFLAAHEQLLGQSVSGYIPKWQPDLDIEELSPDFLHDMHRLNPKIGITHLGCAGDSGLRASGYLGRLFLDEHSFRRLSETPDEFPAKFTTRFLIRSAEEVTISSSPFFMGLNIGMDQTNLLPPFMPAGRNEDAVFGQLLGAGCPGIKSGYLPYALIHDPPDITNRDPSTPVRIQSPRLNDLICWLITSRAQALLNPDSVKRLQAIGSYLSEVGSLPGKDFYEHIRLLVCRVYSQQIHRGEELLANRRNALPAWKERMKTYISEIQRALVQPVFFIPFDMNASEGEALKVCKKTIGRFGELLICWPELVEVSKKIDRRVLRSTRSA